MKKIFVLAIVLVFASVAASFAANTGEPVASQQGYTLFAGVGAAPTGSSDGTLIGKLSTGVYAGWSTDANGYIMTTQHMDGNRSFGSSFDANAIYRNDTVPSDPSAATGNSLNKSYFGGGWTAM